MEEMFKISEFAALTGLSRRQLIVYDHEDILHPAYVDELNGYRYYSVRQVNAAYTIARLREAMISLDDIRAYLTERSPEHLIEMVDKHELFLDRQIEKLMDVKRALQLRRLRARRSLVAEPGTVKIMNVPSRNLFLWPGFPLEGGYRRSMPWEYVRKFYEACRGQGVPGGFPLGIFVDYEQIKTRNWRQAAGFFCHLPVREYPIYYPRLEGLFAVASDFIQKDYPECLYEKLFSFIEENGYQICGNSYEEHLLHFTSDDHAYLVQISIAVEPVAQPLPPQK